MPGILKKASKVEKNHSHLIKSAFEECVWALDGSKDEVALKHLTEKETLCAFVQVS